MSVDLLDKAVSAALCPTFQALAAGSAALPYIPLWTDTTGAPGFAAAQTATALSLLGASATCNQVEIGPDPNFGLEAGCSRAAQGTNLNATLTDGSNQSSTIATNVVSVDNIELGTDQFGYQVWKVSYTKADGTTGVGDSIRGLEEPPPQSIGLVTSESNPCLEGPAPLPIPPMPDVPNTDYTDPDTNCNYTVKFEGLIQESPNGPILPVFEVSGGQTTRSSGGIIGGCVMNPTIYVSPPGGPGGPGGPTIPPIPGPPSPPLPGPDGIPWWLPAVIAGSTAAGLNLIGQEIAKLSEPPFEEGSFTMTAPCDVDEEGNPEYRVWTFPKASFEQRMNAHQVALMEMLQQHLNWKTPICQPETVPLEGEWVTTRWQSDEVMDHSGRRLRKLFRYRSKSSRELQQLSSYWESFVWRSGNVCISHRGAWWGNPQVWAESIEEGKRVIRFAGAEAGLDPDQVGRWEVGGSRSPRYGMPGTMRILRHKAFPWVASRDGADWPNILAREV